jgi:hypothetical protein
MRPLLPLDQSADIFAVDDADWQITANAVADAVHRLNCLIVDAVQAGITVELMRVSRRQDGEGNWGDQIIPLIRQSKLQKGS